MIRLYTWWSKCFLWKKSRGRRFHFYATLTNLQITYGTLRSDAMEYSVLNSPCATIANKEQLSYEVPTTADVNLDWLCGSFSIMLDLFSVLCLYFILLYKFSWILTSKGYWGEQGLGWTKLSTSGYHFKIQQRDSGHMCFLNVQPKTLVFSGTGTMSVTLPLKVNKERNK